MSSSTAVEQAEEQAVVTPVAEVRTAAADADASESNGGIVAFNAEAEVDATDVAVVKEDDVHKPQQKYKYLCFGGIALLVVIAVAIAIPVALTTTTGGSQVDQQQTITSMPSTSPSAAPTSEILTDYLQYLETALPDFIINYDNTTVSNLYDPSSPQYKAAQSIVAEDVEYWQTIRNMDFLLDPSVTLQRFALAVLYYATDGNNWANNDQWLSPTKECTWFGITCNADNQQVIGLDFGDVGNNMRGTLPQEIVLLSGLEQLSATNIMFNSIEALTGLSTLTQLALPRNNIQGTIPVSLLTNNPFLTTIQLQQNALNSTIPTEIGTLSNNLRTWVFCRTAVRRSCRTGTSQDLWFTYGKIHSSTATQPATTMAMEQSNLLYAYQLRLLRYRPFLTGLGLAGSCCGSSVLTFGFGFEASLLSSASRPLAATASASSSCSLAMVNGVPAACFFAGAARRCPGSYPVSGSSELYPSSSRPFSASSSRMSIIVIRSSHHLSSGSRCFPSGSRTS